MGTRRRRFGVLAIFESTMAKKKTEGEAGAPPADAGEQAQPEAKAEGKPEGKKREPKPKGEKADKAPKGDAAKPDGAAAPAAEKPASAPTAKAPTAEGEGKKKRRPGVPPPRGKKLRNQIKNATQRL